VPDHFYTGFRRNKMANIGEPVREIEVFPLHLPTENPEEIPEDSPAYDPTQVPVTQP
jgi:hypothetical protein